MLAITTAACGGRGEHADGVTQHDVGSYAGRGFPFSDAVRSRNLVLLSGQIGLNAEGTLVSGGLRAEAEQALQNLKMVLSRNHLGLEDVLKCTVFLVDMSEWSTFNEVYRNHFSEPFPARTAVSVNALPFNARVEIDCIAAPQK